MVFYLCFFVILFCVFILIGFGNGIEDSGWNVYVGNMKNVNELLGLLYGVYGLGVMIVLLVVILMIIKVNLFWWNFFYFMIGFCVL